MDHIIVEVYKIIHYKAKENIYKKMGIVIRDNGQRMFHTDMEYKNL